MAIAPVFGAPIKRKEDPRFVTGSGSFVDDVQLPGMTYAWRSCARRTRMPASSSIDVSRAREMPGVLAAWTGKDLEDDLNPLPMAWAAGGNSGGEVGGVVNNSTLRASWPLMT